MQGTLPEYTLTLKTETLRTAMAAMAELPFKMVNSQLQEILTQCDAQEAAASAALPQEAAAE